MNLSRRAAQSAATILLLALCSCAPPRSSKIIIGAKNFTEQVVLGELLAQEIEAVYAAEGHQMCIRDSTTTGEEAAAETQPADTE